MDLYARYLGLRMFCAGVLGLIWAAVLGFAGFWVGAVAFEHSAGWSDVWSWGNFWPLLGFVLSGWLALKSIGRVFAALPGLCGWDGVGGSGDMRAADYDDLRDGGIL
jgi:hypothetical protein